MDSANPPIDTEESIVGLAKSPQTERYVFIAQHESGEVASQGAVQDKSGEEEAELVAAYLDALARRTDRSREEVMRLVVSKLNELPAGQPEIPSKGE